MGIIILFFVLPAAVFSFVIGLVISTILGRTARRSCRDLNLEYETRVSSKSRFQLNIGKIFLTSFLTISIWYFSWPVFSSSLDRDLSASVLETLSPEDKWSAALGVYVSAFSVYGFVLGLIPGLTAAICFYAVRKIAVAKVKSA
jgi:tetrahydromethanopterin S-methyltransferase subunit B